MTAQVQEAVRFDTVTEVTWMQLVNASGLSEAEVTELVQYGALVPRDPNAPTWTFESRWLVVARTVAHLHHDFELDAHAVSVVLSYVERISELEAEVRKLRAQLG